MAYLHGHRTILPGLEEALEGKTVNDVIDVVLPPEKAYGAHQEGAIQKVPIKHLASKHKRLLPGTFVKLNTEKGTKDATVVKAGKFMVTVDTNHPVARKTLTFKVTIKDNRQATADEVQHGHAHGPGGRHHESKT